MKSKILKIVILIAVIFILMQINIFASTLTLKVLTDKDIYNIGDNITVTIDWKEEMQAAGFTIKYDAPKLKFETANIKDTFYNLEKSGEIKINWASMEEIDYTKMIFTFKAKEEGTAKIYIENPNAFADGNLVSPTDYDYKTSGTKAITVKQENANIGDNNKNETNKEDNTIATGMMPQTGIEKVTIVGIVALVIMGGIGFTKYKSLTDIK